ncbi:cytochrome P450 [Gautieria morchelliformis]|nr:cytochrome P450 [Gautieria morchelliformis]
MCHSFLKNPQDFIAHVRLTAGRIIMAVTYGLPVQAPDDKYITQAEETMVIIGQATVPGAYMVDLFPSLKHLPSWIPFAPFRKDGLKGRDMIERLITDPFKHVQNEMKLGTARPSFTRDLLEVPRGSSDDEMRDFEDTVRWVAGAMYGVIAGGETTYATTLTFILAMAMHPEIQNKAQREIDEVIGLERLPEISDRPNVPYVNALVKETMRWHPALPLSIARRSQTDDIYEGYFIPAGTIVIPNVWSLASECNRHSAGDFVPERFLDFNGPQDPHTYAFGFGRRVCPGKLLGENSIFILIASLLACFDFFPPLDETGKELPVSPEFSSGLVNYPERYKCRIVARSSVKEAMIEDRALSCRV